LILRQRGVAMRRRNFRLTGSSPSTIVVSAASERPMVMASRSQCLSWKLRQTRE
jgi:hypothetical protein